MSRQRTPKVSHSVDRQRAVARSAAWSLFRPGETWLPYGYRAEIAQVMVSAELGIPECDFTNNVSYLASWLARLRSDRKEIFRAAADAQRIADYLQAYHPDYAARNNGGGEAPADTGEGTGGSSELGDTLSEAA